MMLFRRSVGGLWCSGEGDPRSTCGPQDLTGFRLGAPGEGFLVGGAGLEAGDISKPDYQRVAEAH